MGGGPGGPPERVPPAKKKEGSFVGGAAGGGVFFGPKSATELSSTSAPAGECGVRAVRGRHPDDGHHRGASGDGVSDRRVGRPGCLVRAADALVDPPGPSGRSGSGRLDGPDPGTGGVDRAQHRGSGPQDRGDRPDPHDHRRAVRADQLARPQRGHRGGAGRRARPRAFAVVAAEVRKLAERAQESTGRIQGIVTEVRASTRSTVQASEAGVREAEAGPCEPSRSWLRSSSSPLASTTRLRRRGDRDRHPAAALGFQPGGHRDDRGVRRGPTVRGRLEPVGGGRAGHRCSG